MRKIIVTVAPVAGRRVTDIANPLTPEQIAENTAASAYAGAGMVHLHVRDIYGNLTYDLAEFTRTLDLIRQKTDIIIQGSTGGLSNLTLEERCTALNDLRVEVASLNMGSVNFGESVYINTLPDIRYWAARMKERGVRPELEIFEGGMINNSLILAQEGCLDSSHMVFSFCLGVKGALPANAYNVEFLRSMLPQGSRWGLVHNEMTDFTLLAAAIGMGAEIIRVGYEDSVYYSPGKAAVSNRELVDRVVSMIRFMGCDVASPGEARQILGIGR